MPAIFQIRSKEEYHRPIHERFCFENKHLNIVYSALNDWIIYYQPARRAGERGGRPAGYFARARVVSVHPTLDAPGYSEATLEYYSEFPSVPFSVFDPQLDRKFYYEKSMLESDGSLNKHANQQRVRALSGQEYNRIVEAGFDGFSALEECAIPPVTYSGFAEDPPEPLERDRFLTSRILRDRVFSKLVGEAYEWKCAMTGISLPAPDGSHEIECAHIKPVKDSGPDSVINGIALLRTIHWMFDKGLISIGSDHQIIRSSRYNYSAIDRLINESGKIDLPKNDIHHPHPDFLRYHREHIFERW
jgi:putative restriction endonuclease